MDMSSGDKKKRNVKENPVIKEYQEIGNRLDGKEINKDLNVIVETIERFKFYDQAKSSYAIVQTG